MGRTIPQGEPPPLARLEQGGQAKTDGACQGNVLGCYVHGLFDSGDLCRRLAALLFARRGLDPSQVQTVDYAQYKEEQYDKLAAGPAEKPGHGTDLPDRGSRSGGINMKIQLENVKPADIEARSFAIITQELGARQLPAEN